MPLQLSEELVNFLGTGETSMARSAVIKHLWTYIKENDLQVQFINSTICMSIFTLIPTHANKFLLCAVSYLNLGFDQYMHLSLYHY